MSNKVPYWVYKQQEALITSSHRNYEKQLQNRITELERESSELKKKVVEMENALLIAIDLLMKKL